jgi:hypothetical protein
MNARNRHLEWAAISAAVYHALADHVEPLNAADRINQDHGEHMLAMGQAVAAAVQAHPEAAPPELLAVIDRALAGLPENGGLLAYRAVLGQINSAWLTGDLAESRLVALAQRLVPDEQAENRRLGSTLGGLVRSLGGAERARRLAERFGVGELLAGGQGLAAGEAGARLQAGTAYLVGQSSLASVPHRAESGRIVLQALLREVYRQASQPPAK